MSLDLEHLRQWVGRSETRRERLAPFPADALAATFDRDDAPYTEGAELPPLWHWLYFLPISPLAEAGPDGHPRRGGFLPPVPLPRRMWAGGRFDFHHPLHIGDEVTKTSQVLSVEPKSGRSGQLVFATVRHELADAEGTALSEEHDIVYREIAAPPSKPPPAPEAAAFSREIRPNAVLLFRYSALTFNSHRIHYDHPYVTQVEGYLGLIVHGPLIATLLLDLLRRERPDARPASFAFRAMGPLFDTAPFFVCGRPTEGGFSLWARNPEGRLAMTAEVNLA
jgi:3-methylfumaryl-CoA hydratase